jgi:phospholipase C
VPNLSGWRRRVTGDLTSAFNFAAAPRYGKPVLPQPASPVGCSPNAVPDPGQPFPTQKPGRRGRPSGIVR